ncbi:C10 family peptidase [Methanoculleus chikugoensis]|uniref:C10 family peptidase n=1 Tax=Methanoculleus chikugoensis TaxID=118126 RepID=UPI001C7F4971|nr:C10 family peptidase [Methanoculleus chikugoensis]
MPAIPYPQKRGGRALIAIIIVIAAVCAVLLALHLQPWKPTPSGPPVPAIPTPVVPTVTEPTIIVAASDSSAASKAGADYICDGIDDQYEIQAAIDALPARGGTVQLTEGTFKCSGNILPGSYTTLSGQGDERTTLIFTNNGLIWLKNDSIALEGFRATGSGYSGQSAHRGVIYITASHMWIKDVTATADRSIQAVFYVQSIEGYNRDIEYIAFIGCVADSPGTYGFLHSSQDTEYRVHRYVQYTDCRATDCGRYSRFNNWVTGFDFAELNDIESLRVTRCIAEGNWESGFHLEWAPDKNDVVFTDCISRNNGRKPYPDYYDTSGEYYFGAGYYAPKGSYTFNNCTAEGNSAYGFFFSYPDGVYLYDCTDFETGRGKTDYSQVKPTSFFIVQSLLTHANPSIVMENCESIESFGYGLHIALMDHVQINNFRLTDPAGIDGKGAVVGGSPRGALFMDSSIDIHATGDRVSTLIYAMGNRNVVYSGQIDSNAAHPFVIDGYGTSNVRVQNMQMLPVGSAGIMLTQDVPEGAVTIVKS